MNLNAPVWVTIQIPMIADLIIGVYGYLSKVIKQYLSSVLGIWLMILSGKFVLLMTNVYVPHFLLLYFLVLQISRQLPRKQLPSLQNRRLYLILQK
uniref:Putative product n=1 Tax=Xenopsylla cheopis TaxID=163159 RepID=A0A6M2E054_XENCH